MKSAGRILLYAASTVCLMAQPRELHIEHAECIYFGPRRAEFDKSGLAAQTPRNYEFSRNAIEVVSRLAPLAAKDTGLRLADSDNTIDRHLTQV